MDDAAKDDNGESVPSTIREFLMASVAVWREVDRQSAEPGGYRGISPGTALRKRERTAWEAYRSVLNDKSPPDAMFLGRQVIVTLGEEDGSPVVARGLLLGFGDYGECVIEQEDGEVHYCWPMLNVVSSGGKGPS